MSLQTKAREAMRARLKERMNSGNSYGKHSLPMSWHNCMNETALDAVWKMLEAGGYVRLESCPDDLSFDDLYGDCFDESHADTIPGGMRELRAQKKRAIERLDEDGQWYWQALIADLGSGIPDDGVGWEMVDSIGGFVGDDFEHAGFKPEMLTAGMDAIADQYHTPHWRDCTPDVRQRAQVFVAGLIMGGLDIGEYTLEDFSWS